MHFDKVKVPFTNLQKLCTPVCVVTSQKGFRGTLQDGAAAKWYVGPQVK